MELDLVDPVGPSRRPCSNVGCDSGRNPRGMAGVISISCLRLAVIDSNGGDRESLRLVGAMPNRARLKD